MELINLKDIPIVKEDKIVEEPIVVVEEKKKGFNPLFLLVLDRGCYLVIF